MIKTLSAFSLGACLGFIPTILYPNTETKIMTVCPQERIEQAFQDGMEAESARCQSNVKEVGYEPDYYSCINNFALMPTKYQKDCEAECTLCFANGYENAIILSTNSHNNGYESCKKDLREKQANIYRKNH